MRTTHSSPSAPCRQPRSHRRRRWALSLFLTALAVFTVAATAVQAAGRQPAATVAPTPTDSTVAGSTHKSATPAHKAAARKAAQHKHKATAETAQPVATIKPVVPDAPKLPNWPVNDQPKPATIVWNSAGLRIEAQNASLKQILDDVSTATGTDFVGIDDDERVFGTFGPGSARDVLARLFEGSGYNLLMIGDQGSGNPRQIVLTSRSGKTKTAAASDKTDDADDDVEPEEQPQSPQGQQPVQRNGMNAPDGGRPPMLAQPSPQ
jgi:hypothetical protein